MRGRVLSVLRLFFSDSLKPLHVQCKTWKINKKTKNDKDKRINM